MGSFCVGTKQVLAIFDLSIKKKIYKPVYSVPVNKQQSSQMTNSLLFIVSLKNEPTVLLLKSMV